MYGHTRELFNVRSLPIGSALLARTCVAHVVFMSTAATVLIALREDSTDVIGQCEMVSSKRDDLISTVVENVTCNCVL